MSRSEALAQSCTLILAGHDTTRGVFANGLLAALQHPCQWSALKANPDRVRMGVREMLRYDSPVPYTGRRLLADVDLGGQRLRRGDLAILHIGAANHDPLQFSLPRRFDIGRNEGSHLSFGHGPHTCIGAALTHLQADIGFRALMRAIPDIRLGAGPRAWGRKADHCGLTHLFVRRGEATHASVH